MKHDGYAIFNAQGEPIPWCVGGTKSEAIDRLIGDDRSDRSSCWLKWKRKHQFSVRPIRITEVKK